VSAPAVAGAAPRPSDEQVRVLPAESFAGRAVLVTGAGTGIGRATALRLAELGATVHGVGRRSELLDGTRARAADPAQLIVTPLDIRDRAAAAAFVRDLGPLDLLVNNAGGQFVAPASEISVRGFGAVVDLNLTATAALTAAAYDGLAARGGRVVNLSLANADRGIAGLVHSSTARAAVIGLTGRLARQWRPAGVKLFCLVPGTVLTAGVGEELAGSVLGAAIEAGLLRRDTSVAEVAEWIAALGSGLFDAASGSVVEIDGGASLTDATSVLLGQRSAHG
jgi:citronellol/citronellal dehydrogenase